MLDLMSRFYRKVVLQQGKLMENISYSLHIVSHDCPGSNRATVGARFRPLTCREREILELRDADHASKQIAGAGRLAPIP